MKTLLSGERFSFISKEDKNFIVDFDEEISKLKYTSGGNICSGYCWGKYMIIYSKVGVKDKKVIARIYIREKGIALRLFLNNIDEHREYIEKSPNHIKDAFTDGYGRCKHCKNEKLGRCRFRKTYSIDNQLIEKCNGFTFEFSKPTTQKLPDYMNSLHEFLPKRRLTPKSLL